ncbi:MAG: hypothetical protein ABMB14_27625 [Myxococcota bacterium]
MTTPPVADAAEVSFPSSPPLSIDDASTVDKGAFEINLTAGVAGGLAAWESETPLVDVNYGLTDDIHLNAEVPLVEAGGRGTTPTVRLGAPALAMKVRVLNHDRASLAFHPAVEFPAGVAPIATLPVVLDLAVGRSGTGLGVELAHEFTSPLSADGWIAAIGFAHPVGGGDLMLDYAQSADLKVRLGEGWFEAGFARGRLFGSDSLTLLSSAGISTAVNVSALLGVQVSPPNGRHR